MKYVGMQTQISRNNTLTVMLLILFPAIILGMVWVFLAIINYVGNGYYNEYGELIHQLDSDTVLFIRRFEYSRRFTIMKKRDTAINIISGFEYPRKGNITFFKPSLG